MSNTMDESTVAMFDLVNILSDKLLHISAGRRSVWLPMLKLTHCKMSFPSTNFENASSLYHSRATNKSLTFWFGCWLHKGCKHQIILFNSSCNYNSNN